MYKQCSTIKAVNVDRTAFTAFWCIPKLLFGNVILNTDELKNLIKDRLDGIIEIGEGGFV